MVSDGALDSPWRGLYGEGAFIGGAFGVAEIQTGKNYCQFWAAVGHKPGYENAEGFGTFLDYYWGANLEYGAPTLLRGALPPGAIHVPRKKAAPAVAADSGGVLSCCFGAAPTEHSRSSSL